METMTVDGSERRFFNVKEDSCPICDTRLNEVFFVWNLLHGEAKASCCGADYQLKDLYIDHPTEDQLKYLAKLREPDMICISIRPECLTHIRTAMAELKVERITGAVLKRTKELMRLP